jgi:hypothetical protein
MSDQTEPLYLLPVPTNNGSGSRKRDLAQREHDLMIVSQAYLRGKSVKEICKIVNDQHKEQGLDIELAINTLYDDIQEIHTRWINSSMIDFDEAKGRELDEWNNLERAYWDAWERSLVAKTIDEHQDIYDEVAFAMEKVMPVHRTKTRKKVEERDGNVVYLQGVERCITERCKIIGLYSPERFQVDWRIEARRAGVDPKAASDAFEAMVGKFQEQIEAGHEEG